MIFRKGLGSRTLLCIWLLSGMWHSMIGFLKTSYLWDRKKEINTKAIIVSGATVAHIIQDRKMFGYFCGLISVLSVFRHGYKMVFLS